jgi:hypothetical protein
VSGHTLANGLVIFNHGVNGLKPHEIGVIRRLMQSVSAACRRVSLPAQWARSVDGWSMALAKRVMRPIRSIEAQHTRGIPCRQGKPGQKLPIDVVRQQIEALSKFWSGWWGKFIGWASQTTQEGSWCVFLVGGWLETKLTSGRVLTDEHGIRICRSEIVLSLK